MFPDFVEFFIGDRSYSINRQKVFSADLSIVPIRNDDDFEDERPVYPLSASLRRSANLPPSTSEAISTLSFNTDGTAIINNTEAAGLPSEPVQTAPAIPARTAMNTYRLYVQRESGSRVQFDFQDEAQAKLAYNLIRLGNST